MIVERLWQERYAQVFAILSERAHLAGNWPATRGIHEAILQAIRSRDPRAAREPMRAHLRQTLDAMAEDAGARREGAPRRRDDASPLFDKIREAPRVLY